MLAFSTSLLDEPVPEPDLTSMGTVSPEQLLHVILVEDDEHHAELIARELRQGGFSARCLRVDTMADLESALDRGGWDLVLSDFALPGFDGEKVLRRVKERELDLPFIFVSGAIGEEKAVALMKAGATDYVPKDRLDRLALVVRRAVREADEHRARRRAEEELRRSEERFRLLAENAPDVIFRFRLVPEFRVEYLSPAFESITGRPSESVISNPQTGLDVIHPHDRAAFRARFAAPEEIGDAFTARWLGVDGAVLWMELRMTPVHDETGLLVAVDGVARDITKLKEVEAQLAQQALHDPLTGLPNRRLLLDRLEQALTRRAREDTTVAILFVDLDGFKAVNDRSGHAAGDRLLIAVANGLRVHLRPSDTVARMGGDEFAVLLPDLTSAHQAARLAVRIKRSISDLRVLDGSTSISASIGIAYAHNDKDQPEDLLHRSDTAMYRAKAAGGSRIELFDDATRASVAQRLAAEEALQRAFDGGGLALVYQPVIHLESEQLLAVEAIPRWNRDDGAPLEGGELMELAEDSGLIVPIGRWVIHEVCRQTVRWRAAHPSVSLKVHVNLSAAQLARPAWVEELASIIEESAVDPSWLCLEVAESTLEQDAGGSLARLHALRRLGVELSIDGFGSGSTPLGYLRRFPVGSLKIGGAFVRGLGSDPIDSGLVATAIRVAQSLDLDVFAEGIENRRQRAGLIALGCTQGQGFHLAAPQPAEAIDEMLSSIES